MSDLYFFVCGYISGLFVAWLLAKARNVSKYKRETVFCNQIENGSRDDDE